MKAIVQERFGPPETLRLAEIDTPEIGADDVLIRVRAASLNPYDWHMLRGDPKLARLTGVGLTRPKARIAGIDVAGEVEALGVNVDGLSPGDEVFGFAPGAFAEYARAGAKRVAPKPPSLTFEQAAAVPMAGVTALQGIRDAGQAKAGQRVLVNGAAGGVGTFAVQIAAALGAEVTGVCSSRNVEMVRSIGAAYVIDYTTHDFADGRVTYDLILDNVGNRSLGDLRRALTPAGTLIANAGGPPGQVIGAIGRLVQTMAVNGFVKQRLRPLLATQDQADLRVLSGLIEDGKVRPVLDQTFNLADTADGLQYLERGHAAGKVVVSLP